MWISGAFLLFALAVNGVINGASADRGTISRRCPANWDKFGTQCFRYFSEPKSWAEAEQKCVELGGNLASVHSEITHKFLKTYVVKHHKANTRTWIGAHDATQAFIWFWSDGSKFDYSDWHTGEPNNGGGRERCVEMGFGDEKRWNDARCDIRLHFICHRVARMDF